MLFMRRDNSSCRVMCVSVMHMLRSDTNPFISQSKCRTETISPRDLTLFSISANQKLGEWGLRHVTLLTTMTWEIV